MHRLDRRLTVRQLNVVFATTGVTGGSRSRISSCVAPLAIGPLLHEHNGDIQLRRNVHEPSDPPGRRLGLEAHVVAHQITGYEPGLGINDDQHALGSLNKRHRQNVCQ